MKTHRVLGIGAILLLAPLATAFDAGMLYGVNSSFGGNNFLAKIDKNTGAVTIVGAISFVSDGLDFGPDGTLYAADNSNAQLVELDPNTAAVTVIGPYNGGGGIIEGLAAHPTTGVLYGIDVLNDSLVTLNTSTGQVTTVGSFNVGDTLMAGLAWKTDGTKLYAIHWGSGCLYDVNPVTGNASLIGCGDAAEPLALAEDSTTGELYTAEWQGGLDMTLARVNPTTGARTVVGTMAGADQIEGLGFGVDEGVGTKYCTANANSTGSPADIGASGSSSSSAGDLTLDAAPVPNQNGIFFHGMNQSQVPFGNGFMCTTGDITRGAVVLGAGNAATYTYDNSDAKHSLAAYVGMTRNFQYWFRDPMGGGAFFNTSNAISIAITP